MLATLVMLVDDEKPFVETMLKRLGKRNLNVIPAYSGQEALEILKKNQNLDVVILDVKMPGMDGIGTLGEIKKRYPLTEVIMLTAHATVESAIEGMKLGAYDYLMKPCDIDQLMAKVEAAVNKKREHEDKIREAKVREALAEHGLG
ncbi:MAG: response regulator [Deltaproteobacteria bacterium]|nr:response regulator [Deltaproteobacteria bacterium]